ncbi:hypothetical protein AeMF1_020419 [Aphanomyces euteiches]|nr:hypothetical protein AeMF1_020419 [Aphanomyces euteiches]KAH9195210.1 hypothetical protein AeNC1_002817 [Aphanomyces euteiches]
MICRARNVASLLWLLRPCIADIPWRPFTALRPGHLLAYFPFDTDLQDASPLGDPADNLQTQLNINVTLVKRKGPNGLNGQSAYFNGESYLEAQVNINCNIHPEITMGAWVFIPEYSSNLVPQSFNLTSNDTSRFIMTHSTRGNFERSLAIDDRAKGWTAFTGNFGYGVMDGLAVNAGSWSFVAVSYNQARNSTLLYVDGKVAIGQTSMRMGQSILRIGSGAYPGSGFVGYMNHVFIYNAALNSGELNFLRTTVAPGLEPVVGTAGYSLMFTSSVLYKMIALLPNDPTLQNAVTLSMYASLDFSLHSRLCLCSFRSSLQHVIYLEQDTQSNSFHLDLVATNSTFELKWTAGGIPLPASATWIHVAFTWTLNVFNFYLNGALQATTPYNVPLVQANGEIYEIQLWNLAKLPQDMTKKLRGDDMGLLGYWDMDYSTNGHPNLEIQSKAYAYSPRLFAELRILAYTNSVAGSTFLSESQAPVGDLIYTSVDEPVEVLLNSSYFGLNEPPLKSITRLPEKGSLFTSSRTQFDVTTAKAVSNVPFTLPKGTKVYFMPATDSYTLNGDFFEFTAVGAKSTKRIYLSVIQGPVLPHFEMTESLIQRLSGYRFEDVDTNEYYGTVDASIQVYSSQSYVQLLLPSTDLSAHITQYSDTNLSVSLLGDPGKVTAVANQIDIQTPSASTISTQLSIEVKDTGPANDPSVTYQQTVQVRFDNDFGNIPIISLIEPRLSYMKSGGIVSITGQNIYPNMTCRFLNVTTQAIKISSSKVQCPIPASPRGTVGIVPLSLLLHGQFESRSVQFLYVEPLQIFRVFPAVVSSSGGSVLTIEVSYVSDQMFCVMGEAIVPALTLAPTFITCRTPPLSASFVNLAVSPNRIDLTNAPSPLQVLPAPNAIWLNPPMRPVGISNNWIEVHGTKFVELAKCYVDNRETQMKFYSASLVFCNVPSSFVPRVLNVTVAISFTEAVLSSLMFEYVDAVHLNRLVPTNGPVSGGTILNIHGSNFQNVPSLSCRFESSTLVPAVFVSEIEVLCVTPMLSTYQSLLEITLNGQDFSDDVLFFYGYNSASISKIYPPLGPGEGGTTVTVFGDGFTNIPSLACEFGALSSTARFISSTVIQCLSPASTNIQSDIFKLSMNGQDILMNPSVRFQYYPRGTLVLFTGTFPTSGLTQCKFGSQVVQAKRSTNAEIECVTPSQTHTYLAPIALAMNGLQFESTPYMFDYFAVPYIEKIFPQFLPLMTTCSVKVSGSFPPSTYAVTCRIGGNVVNGHYINASIVQCDPILWSIFGDILIELSWNTQDFTASGQSVKAHLPLSLDQVQPSGSLYGRSQQVILKGSNYLVNSSLVCVWNHSTLTPATYISDSQVLCISPAQLPIGETAVALTLNGGIDLSPSLSFTVEPPPRVSSISPTFGPAQTEIQIVVNRPVVAKSVNCLFDGHFTNGYMPNSTIIYCTVPSVFQPKVLTLQLAVWDLIVPTNFSFMLVNQLSVLEVFPTTVGLNENLTWINVYVDVPPQLSIDCIFGNIWTSISTVTSVGLKCLAPPQSEEVLTNLTLSIGKQYIINTGYSIAYTKVTKYKMFLSFR